MPENRSYLSVVVFGLLLLAAFFIPWVKWENEMIPGYAMPSGDFFAISSEKFGLDNPYPKLNLLLKIFWLIPAAALIAVIAAIMKKNTSAASVIGGVTALALVTVFILFTKTLLLLGVGKSLISSLAIGIYLTAFSAIGLITAGIHSRPPLKLALIIAGPLIAWVGFLIIEKKTAGEKYDDTANVQSAYTVWSQDLIREFTTNDSAANAKYREKILTVRGRISETEMPNDSTINIKMSDSTGSYLIFPLLDHYVDKARNLKPGDSIEIRGSCSGGMYSEILETETVTFKRCALIQTK